MSTATRPNSDRISTLEPTRRTHPATAARLPEHRADYARPTVLHCRWISTEVPGKPAALTCRWTEAELGESDRLAAMLL